jgi:DNA repair protein RadC
MNNSKSIVQILRKAKTFSPAALSDRELFCLIFNEVLHTQVSFEQLKGSFGDFFDLRQLRTFSDQDWTAVFTEPKETWKGKAICEIAKRIEKHPKLVLGKVCSSNTLGHELIEEIGMLSQEVLMVIVLDTKNQVLARKIIFQGTLDSATVHPREIFNFALRYATARIIIAHNHPSGDPTPSQNDLKLTARLKKCGEIIGIELLDHLIIGSITYVSLQEERLIR